MPKRPPNQPSFYRDPNYVNRFNPPPPPPPPPIPNPSAITLYQPPPPLTKYSPPGALTKFAPPKIPVPPPGLGSAVGGSFKAATTSGAIARGAAKLGGRALPGIGWAFFALDVALLACAAGLLPSSVCPRPESPSPGGKAPPFSGGQCVCKEYRVYFSYQRSRFPGQRVNNSNTCWGPVERVTIEKTDGGDDAIWFYCRGKKPNPCGAPGQRILAATVGLFLPETTFDLRVDSIVLEDGSIDNCGNPPPTPEPRQLPDIYQFIDIHKSNINLNINLPNFLPPSPNPKRAPSIVSPPSPLPDIKIDFGDIDLGEGGELGDLNLDYYFSANPGGNYSDFPDFFNNAPPSPQPRLKNPDPFVLIQNPPGSTGSLNNLPEIPPPLPDKLPDDASDSDKYQMRQNKEITDKLYRLNGEILEIQSTLEKQNKVLENLQKLIDFEVQGSQIITRCDDLDFVYSYKDKVLSAITKQLDHLKAIDQIIIDEICEVEKESVLASPDWWQVRLNGDTPQIALIFRVRGKRTYHKLTIPHPVNTNKLILPPIPSYEKGNWQGEIVCIDNSKFLCNCVSKEEAERLVGIASTLINPAFLGNPIRAYFAERKGVAVSPGSLLATSALYFPKGQQQTKPEWRSTFTKFGI